MHQIREVYWLFFIWSKHMSILPIPSSCWPKTWKRSAGASVWPSSNILNWLFTKTHHHMNVEAPSAPDTIWCLCHQRFKACVRNHQKSTEMVRRERDEMGCIIDYRWQMITYTELYFIFVLTQGFSQLMPSLTTCWDGQNTLRDCRSISWKETAGNIIFHLSHHAFVTVVNL